MCHSDEVRDTSIRIFDTYLIMRYMDSPDVLKDKSKLAFIAAASMILSSKLFNMDDIISAVSSPLFVLAHCLSPDRLSFSLIATVHLLSI